MQSTTELLIALKQLPKPIENGWEYLDQIPKSEMYRLVVDSRLLKRENGPIAYERRERGCIQAFLHALRYCQENKNRPITLFDILNIHSLASSHRDRDSNFPKIRGARRDVHINLVKDTLSVAGLIQYLDAIEKEGHVVWGEMHIAGFVLSEISLAKIREQTSCKTNAQLAHHLYDHISECNKLFPPNPKFMGNNFGLLALMSYLESFYRGLSEINDPAQKIRWAVSRLAQPSEVMHAFTDTNIRTTIILMLNSVLMNEGFPPAIFEDPNCFDMHSVDECVDLVIAGMHRTMQLIEQKTLPGFTVSSLSSEDQLIINRITQSVNVTMMRERLSEFLEQNQINADAISSIYKKHFASISLDPYDHLRFLVKVAVIAEYLPVTSLENYFETPLQPLEKSVSKEDFWRDQGYGLPTWLTGDHSYRLSKDAVSLLGLVHLFNKIDSEDNKIHWRLGILSSCAGIFEKSTLADLRGKHQCVTNEELAARIYHSDKSWPMTNYPLYNDAASEGYQLTQMDALRMVRERYEREIKKADNYRGKILVIVETIQELCLVMPYRQDNPKRMVPLINKLLVENGLPPATKFGLFEFDKFILFSPQELAQIVVEKCCSALAIIRGKLSVEEAMLDSPTVLQELNSALKAFYQIYDVNFVEVPIELYRERMLSNAASKVSSDSELTQRKNIL